jgi:YidC/Oxa1 family membrane protein insertase
MAFCTRLARFAVFAFLLLTALVANPASAQLAGSTAVNSPLPPPPAFAIAQRLAASSDYNDAIKKLQQVTSSATYKSTPYAPEAIYSIAHIYEDNLHDDTNAITQLNTLVNNYSAAAPYPHQGVVLAERNALGKRINVENLQAALHPFKYVHVSTANPFSPIVYVWDIILTSGYIVVDFFVHLTGDQSWSYWVALFLISLIVRLLLWPLSVKQYRSMKEMQRMQPLMKELQAKYKNDKQTLAAKQMELYKEHNVNPAAGCAPMVMQLPVFIYMYHAVWLYQYRFSQGTFLWVTPKLHHMFPAIFGANLSDQDIPLLGLYAISMYVTQRMMPATDPQQAEMQRTSALMSAFLFFFLFQSYHFPSAFVLYWFFSNVVSTAVQMFVMRQNALAPASSAVILPTDGSTAPVTEPRNGSGGAKSLGNGSSYGRNGADGAQPGAAKGAIAPKIHPKKKRR